MMPVSVTMSVSVSIVSISRLGIGRSLAVVMASITTISIASVSVSVPVSVSVVSISRLSIGRSLAVVTVMTVGVGGGVAVSKKSMLVVTKTHWKKVEKLILAKTVQDWQLTNPASTLQRSEILIKRQWH